MKKTLILKSILASVLLSLFMTGACFANTLPSQSGFPFKVDLGMDYYDKLCYAGHVTGGGMFYDDGYMVTPGVTFTVNPLYGGDSEALSSLSLEIDLIYENSDNTSCVKEVIKKYDFGDVKSGKEYPLLSETVIKSLKQRKKLYSSDVMSVKMVLTYKAEGISQKKQAYLLYLARDEEYKEKKNVLAAPPESE